MSSSSYGNEEKKNMLTLIEPIEALHSKRNRQVLKRSGSGNGWRFTGIHLAIHSSIAYGIYMVICLKWLGRPSLYSLKYIADSNTAHISRKKFTLHDKIIRFLFATSWIINFIQTDGTVDSYFLESEVISSALDIVYDRVFLSVLLDCLLSAMKSEQTLDV